MYGKTGRQIYRHVKKNAPFYSKLGKDLYNKYNRLQSKKAERQRQDSEAYNPAHTRTARKIISGKKTFMSKAIRQAPPNHHITTSNSTATSPQGKQQITFLDKTLDKAFIDTFMPYSVEHNRKFFVESIIQDWEFTNSANVPGEVTFYQCTPKTNSVDTATTCIKNGYLSKFGNVDVTDKPYIYPEGSVVFQKNWKVLSKMKFILAPGELKHIHVYRQINKFFNLMELDKGTDNTEAGNWFPYKSLFTFIHIKGSVVQLTSGGASISEFNVPWFKVQKFKYRYPSGTAVVSAVNTFTNGLDPATQAKVMIPESGDSKNVTHA